MGRMAKKRLNQKEVNNGHTDTRNHRPTNKKQNTERGTR